VELYLLFLFGAGGSSFFRLASLANFATNTGIILARSELELHGGTFCGSNAAFCPLWKPLTIVLRNVNNRYIFRNPFVLMDAVVSMVDAEVRHLYAQPFDSVGNNAVDGHVDVGIAIAPEAPLYLSTLLTSKLLLGEEQTQDVLLSICTDRSATWRLEEPSRACNSRLDSVDTTQISIATTHPKDVTTVCSLLKSSFTVKNPSGMEDSGNSDRTSGLMTEQDVKSGEYFHIFNITTSVPWLRTVSHLQKTAGVDYICSNY
jgi:hypothetical protein